MILEGVITTRNADAAAHITPMGFQRHDDTVLIAPFVPSTTLVNLRRDGHDVLILERDGPEAGECGALASLLVARAPVTEVCEREVGDRIGAGQPAGHRQTDGAKAENADMTALQVARAVAGRLERIEPHVCGYTRGRKRGATTFYRRIHIHGCEYCCRGNQHSAIRNEQCVYAEHSPSITSGVNSPVSARSMKSSAVALSAVSTSRSVSSAFTCGMSMRWKNAVADSPSVFCVS